MCMSKTTCTSAWLFFGLLMLWWAGLVLLNVRATRSLLAESLQNLSAVHVAVERCDRVAEVRVGFLCAGSGVCSKGYIK